MSIPSKLTNLTSAMTAFQAAYNDRAASQRASLTQLQALQGVKNQAVLIGASGQVLNLVGGDLCRQVNFATSDAEVSTAQGTSESFAQVFSTWQRFSLDTTANVPAQPTELNNWSLSGNNLLCTVNSNSLIGFVSPNSYTDYVFEVQLSSTDSDDDYIGIVFGYALDGNGRPHTLTAGRTPGSNTGTMKGLFGVAYDYYNADVIDLGSTNGGLKWGDGVVDNTRVLINGKYPGWGSQGIGTRVRVARSGDVITLDTTDMNTSSPYVSTAQVVVDLNSNPALSIFKGSSPIGYCCLSQNSATWATIQKPTTPADFVDARNGNVYRWNSTANSWSVVGTTSNTSTIDKGRFYYSPLNSKVFYVSTAGVVRSVT